LPNVPRTVGEAAPAAVEIFNEIDHPWVARGEIPRELLLDGSGNPRRLLLVRMHPDPQGFVAQLLPEYEAEQHTVRADRRACSPRRKIEKVERDGRRLADQDARWTAVDPYRDASRRAAASTMLTQSSRSMVARSVFQRKAA
jgi:hypothetical protein